MSDKVEPDDLVKRLLLRVGLKQHQLPAARRLLFVGVLGLLLLVAFDLMDSLAADPSPPPTEPYPYSQAEPVLGRNSAPPLSSLDIAAWEQRLNEELAFLLGQVKDAGTVAVYVRLEASPVQSVAQQLRTNTRSSLDADETIRREVTEVEETSQPVLAGSGGGQPVIVSVSSPTVESVLVLADGADIPGVRGRLQQAVTGALGVRPHRIQIVAREEPLR